MSKRKSEQWLFGDMANSTKKFKVCNTCRVSNHPKAKKCQNCGNEVFIDNTNAIKEWIDNQYAFYKHLGYSKEGANKVIIDIIWYE